MGKAGVAVARLSLQHRIAARAWARTLSPSMSPSLLPASIHRLNLSTAIPIFCRITVLCSLSPRVILHHRDGRSSHTKRTPLTSVLQCLQVDAHNLISKRGATGQTTRLSTIDSPSEFSAALIILATLRVRCSLSSQHLSAGCIFCETKAPPLPLLCASRPLKLAPQVGTSVF